MTPIQPSENLSEQPTEKLFDGQEQDGNPVETYASWQQDLLKGFLWAVLILVSILFYTGTASHFVYVDF